MVEAGFGGFWALSLTILLGLHTARIALLFLVHYYDAANRRGSAANPTHYARTFLGEWWYSLISTILIPFGTNRAKDRAFDPNGGPAIVMVHGLATNRGKFFWLAWHLKRQGYRNVVAINLGRMTDGFPSLQEGLALRLKGLSEWAGQPVLVVAHSMGGLVVRSALDHHPDLRVKRVLTVGSPHHGTRVAVFGFSRGVRSLVPRAKEIKKLSDDHKDKIQSLTSAHDQMIVPPDSAKYGTEVETLPMLGHEGLIQSARARKAILNWIKSGSVEGSGTPQDPS